MADKGEFLQPQQGMVMEYANYRHVGLFRGAFVYVPPEGTTSAAMPITVTPGPSVKTIYPQAP